MSFVKKLSTFFSKRDVDMTQGRIVPLLIEFAIPLMLGNLLQQLYNTVDTWVVGNYVGDSAFSAVGNVGPIINLLIGFFMGLSAGAGVVISQYYGAKQEDKVQDTVHTAITITLILGVVFTAVGILMTPTMLRIMNMPTAEIHGEATAYLTIYFSGMISLMMYNMGSGILRAVGDSLRPFYFLAVSALTNTVLDLVFVLVFKMGVRGVALATVLAQTLSAALIIITLIRIDNCVKLRPRRLKVHWDMFKKILKVGIPAALQMAITSFSNIFVQSYINHFGDACMGGWTAYSKIDQFLLLPMQSISLASTTFVGQNLGVNQVERAKKGVRTAMLLSIGSMIVLMIPVLIFAEPLVTFFNDNPEIIKNGAHFLRLMSPFYVFCCVNQIYAGALRGAGDSKAPMFIMVGSFVIFRQIYLYLVANYFGNSMTAIVFGYPAGWLLCSAATLIYFKFSHWEKHRLVQ